MSLSSVVKRNDYAGNGATTVFAYTFRVFAATDLVVIKRNAAGLETVLAYATDFTVTGVNNAAGGNVTLLGIAPASGETLTIMRNMSPTQPTSFVTAGSFFASSHEDTFDRVVMLLQQQQDQLDRAIRLARSYPPGSHTLEIPPGTVGQVLTGTGTGFGWTTLDSSAIALPGQQRTVATVSAYLANNAVFNVMDYGAKGDGVTDDTTVIAAAQTACGSAGEVFFPAGTYLINTNLRFTSAVRLAPGAVFKPANAVTVTFAGRLTALPLTCFDTSLGGSFTFGVSVPELYPEWWGAKADNTTDCAPGLQAAINASAAAGTAVRVGSGYYQINSTIVDANGASVTLHTAGPDKTVFTWNGAIGGTVFHWTKDRGAVYGGFQVKGRTAGLNYNFTAWHNDNCSRWYVENVWWVSADIACQVTTGYGNTFVGCNIFDANTRGINLLSGANSNQFYMKGCTGRNIAGSEGIHIEGTANVITGGELTAFDLNVHQVSGPNNELHSWFNESPVTNAIQVEAGTLITDTFTGYRVVVAEGALLVQTGGALGVGGINIQRNHRVPVRGLTAYYPMQEGSGTTLVDHSGNGRHATLTAPTWTTDVYGSGVQFDSTGKIAIPAAAFTYNQPWSIAILLRNTAWGASNRNEVLYLADGSGHTLEVRYVSDTSMKVLSNGATIGNITNGSPHLSDRVWVCLTYDGASALASVNGIYYPITASAQMQQTVANPFSGAITVAQVGDASSGTLIVGALAVWNRVLTWDEMLEFQALADPMVPPASRAVLAGTASTVGAAGAATALPAQPLGYKIEYLPGVGNVKTPYYNV